LWHSDVTWDTNPPKYSILHMQVHTVGGDTMVVRFSMSRSRRCRHRCRRSLEPLTARISIRSTLSIGADHPLVCRHPVTGRKASVLQQDFTQKINEVEPAESAALWPCCTAHAARPEFSCRWRWTPGDIAIWETTSSSTTHSRLRRSRPGDHRIEIEGRATPPGALGRRRWAFTSRR